MSYRAIDRKKSKKQAPVSGPPFWVLDFRPVPSAGLTSGHFAHKFFNRGKFVTTLGG